MIRSRFYFACVSPWSYLGLDALKEIADKTRAHDCLQDQPMSAAPGKKPVSGKPLGERPDVMKAYRLLELPRWAAWRGVPLNAEPKHFPAPFYLSSNVIIAAGQAGEDMFAVTRALMRGGWVEERNIGDANVTSPKFSTVLVWTAHTLVAAAGSDAVAAELSANTDEALADNAWSVPSICGRWRVVLRSGPDGDDRLAPVRRHELAVFARRQPGNRLDQ